MVAELLVKAQGFLRQRRLAYLRTFNLEDRDNAAVLADLAQFCRADKTTFHPDPRVEGRLDGRREVWLRIQHHLKLSDDQLWTIYGERNK